MTRRRKEDQRAGRAEWRKKCFQLPLRCFTLSLHNAMAVVDPELRVHRIAGLRVADAVTIMIGERVADLGREQLRLAA
jgi:hypothetical protein